MPLTQYWHYRTACDPLLSVQCYAWTEYQFINVCVSVTLSVNSSSLSVIGVGVTTRVHVPGPLFDDFFYTDRAEI